MNGKHLATVIFLSACAVEHPESHRATQEQPVRVSDVEAEKALRGVKPADPQLHDPRTYRDPSLFVDLDAFIKSEGSRKLKVVPSGEVAQSPEKRRDSASEPGHAGDGPYER